MSATKKLEVDDETLDDLIDVVDDRLHFIKENLHRNPDYLGKELERLTRFFKVIDCLRNNVDYTE
jgi:hypothetical protein